MDPPRKCGLFMGKQVHHVRQCGKAATAIGGRDDHQHDIAQRQDNGQERPCDPIRPFWNDRRH